MMNNNAAKGMPSSAEDLNLLVEAVREAGALALSYYGKLVATKIKDDGSPVSEADLAVDRLLHQRLLDARPDYGWLSEESADDFIRLERRAVWIVDPIDGTLGFIKGRPEWTVIAALVVDNRPVISVVYNPSRDEMFTATRDGGAWLNGDRIMVSITNSLAGSRLYASQVLLADNMWPEPWPQLQFLRSHSLAYRMAQIAAGRADGAISVNVKAEWDLAAPSLLLEEAGGKVTCIDGAAFTFNQKTPSLNGMVAAGQPLHELLIARTKLLAGQA